MKNWSSIMINTDQRIWVITDTHFNHKMIVKYEDRPENYQELIINNWRRLVSKDDLVIHLGDVIFARQGELTDILTSLPGTKILTGGNHDRNKAQWYLDHGFTKVCHHLIMNNVLFSHKPYDIKDYGLDYNIHGHFHRETLDDITEPFPFYGEQQIKLAIEETDYCPMLVETIINERKENKLRKD